MCFQKGNYYNEKILFSTIGVSIFNASTSYIKCKSKNWWGMKANNLTFWNRYAALIYEHCSERTREENKYQRQEKWPYHISSQEK